MKTMHLSISAQQAKNVLLSKIRTDQSLIKLAYTIFTNKKGVFGKLYGDRFWLVDLYDENSAVHARIFPKRFYFGNIIEHKGKAIIKGKFAFPWVYSIAYGIFFANVFLMFFELSTEWQHIAKTILFIVIVTAVFVLQAMLFGYIDNQKYEKKMLHFLKETYGEFIVTEIQ